MFSDKNIEWVELTNYSTIYQKVYIYNSEEWVYYCIHVERKGALDASLRSFLREREMRSISSLCLCVPTKAAPLFLLPGPQAFFLLPDM